MKWVKCVYNGDSYSNELTIGKIYEVLIFSIPKTVPRIEIIKDNGESDTLYMKDSGGVWFEDITAEVRNNKINQIINEVG